MPVERRLQRRGESVMATIPSDFCKQLGLEPGMRVEVQLVGDSVVMRRAREIPPPSPTAPR